MHSRLVVWLLAIQPIYGGEEQIVTMVGYAKLFSACVILAMLGSAASIVQLLRGFGRSYWLALVLVAGLGIHFSAQRVMVLDQTIRHTYYGPYWDFGWSVPWCWLNHVPSATMILLTLLVANAPALFLPRRGSPDDCPLNLRLTAQTLALMTAVAIWLPALHGWCVPGQPNECTFARVRIGMSRDEVITLMGPPEPFCEGIFPNAKRSDLHWWTISRIYVILFEDDFVTECHAKSIRPVSGDR